MDCKEKTIEHVYSNWENSYNELPHYLLALKKFVPGTVVKMQTLPIITNDDTIDGTWSYGKYKGTLPMAVAQDGNNNIFPVVFALVEDKHATIESEYNNPDNGWHDPPSVHVNCIKHIAQNFMREIKDCYALNRPTFHYYRNQIGMANGDTLMWLDNIPVEKWTRAYDGGRRWGHVTTNLAKSMNSSFKGTHLNSGQTFTESCIKVMKEETTKSSSYHERIIDYNHNPFSVKVTMDHGEGKYMGDYKVNLRDLWCDCGKYQAYCVPCSHVIDACSVVRQDAYALLSDVYGVSNLFGVYSTSFLVLPLDEYLPSLMEIKFATTQ
ncbi:uncharacterized protein LOC131629957 [Vicia villosa]|uniref:uncharacterized protein LOC131629957 n=1 Tax=Vicia villosa TaxID=3911 RepID=UPI00273B00ED|nr:uncharacterized protein LOC131629957 [Vicia villosa]